MPLRHQQSEYGHQRILPESAEEHYRLQGKTGYFTYTQQLICTDGAPCAVKIASTVRSGGKSALTCRTYYPGKSSGLPIAMDIDRLIHSSNGTYQRHCFGSLMDIDRLILGGDI